MSFPAVKKSLVIRQKGESQNGCYKKTEQTKFGVLCFIVTPVLRFALLPYCRRSIIILVDAVCKMSKTYGEPNGVYVIF